MMQWTSKLRLAVMEERNDLEATILSLLFTAFAVATTAIVIYGAYFGGITALLLRSMFFSSVSVAGLILVGSRFANPAIRIFCYALAAFALVPGIHLYNSYFDIIMRGAMSTALDEWIFLGLLAVVVVLVRLSLGWALIILMGVALAYAYFGYLIPGSYGHGGYDLARLTSTLYLSTEGFFGLPMGVAVEYIFLFSLLGTFLMRIGTGGVFVDLARGVTGHVQGGPGLSAAVSSTLMGTINGSAVANVVTTGTFTIPLMKRSGYSANVAGAIEAAASSAGQILPPIMGAAAFLMAEIIGVPYRTIALAALIPGVLYVLALIVAVRLEAGRLNLAPDPDAGWQLFKSTILGRGYLLLPLVGLVVLLFAGYTPTRAAVYCLLFGLLIMPWSRETRTGIVGLMVVCRDTLVSTLPIVAAVAAAGAVIGVLNLTGLGLMLSGMIIDLGGGRIWLILILTAIASFILGMGLPTSAAYLLLAVLVAPALTRLGLEPIVSHMFIFYYGLVSAITPPVALAAYAAASISGGDANKTAIESIRLGFVKLLVPFLFVTMPGLLMVGSGLEIALSAFFAALGVIGLTVAFAGWLVRPLVSGERLLMAAGALLVLWPTEITALDPATLAARCAGMAILAFTLLRLCGAAHPRKTEQHDFLMSSENLPYHPSPKKPDFALPPGACDAHCHVFGPAAAFPFAPERTYTPVDAPKETLFALHRYLGIERSVLVQASCHGTDNSAMLDMIAHSEGRYRGVAMVKADVSEEELARLHAGGVRGVRFNFVSHLGKDADFDAIRSIVAKIVPLGWHAVVHFDADRLPMLKPFLSELPLPMVIDHMGRVDASKGVEQEAFGMLLDLMEDERFWVKVCGSERISRAGPPFHDAVPFAKMLVERFPDRALWGTDWPHPNIKKNMPDDGALVDLLALIAPRPELMQALLVDNPTRLYWPEQASAQADADNSGGA